MKQRKPAVAGAFYPADPDELRQMLSELTEPKAAKVRALGIVAPHAGYIYSGAGAGAIFSRVEIPEDVLVMGPNHRGTGADVAIEQEGSWLTPLGEVKINSELAKLVMAGSSLIKNDERAHQSEHSLEVQVPFLQYFRPDFKLVPICLGSISYAECLELGKALAAAIKKWGRQTLIVASSDMSHYIAAEKAKRKDDMAIERILKLDAENLFDKVWEQNITMCGFIPATVMLIAAKELGAKQAELVDYRNSGDVTGDYREVVAYAAIMVR